MDYIVVHK